MRLRVPRSLQIVAGTLLASASCVVGEPQQEEWKVTTCPPESCLADPYAHCVDFAHCRSSSDCPVGTRCTDVVRVSVEDPSSRTMVEHSCRPVLSLLDGSNRLMSGFHVPELMMQRDSGPGEPAVFSLEIPNGTREVHCAVFMARPEFAPDIRVDGSFRTGIYNYDHSVFAEAAPQISADGGARARFEVTEASEHRPENPYRCGTELAASPYNLSPNDVPVVSELTAGCWTIGETQVTRASRLYPLAFPEAPFRRETRRCPPVRPANASTGAGGEAGSAGEASGGGSEATSAPDCRSGEVFYRFGVSSCDSFSEGFNCSPTLTGGFGVCFQGECTARCSDYDDCQSAGYPDACCLLGDGRFLGACGRVDQVSGRSPRAECQSTTIDSLGKAEASSTP